MLNAIKKDISDRECYRILISIMSENAYNRMRNILSEPLMDVGRLWADFRNELPDEMKKNEKLLDILNRGIRYMRECEALDAAMRN